MHNGKTELAMETNSNRQNQALVILTIGTAVLGFGLFQVEFTIFPLFSDLESGFKRVEVFIMLKLLCGGLAAVWYIALFGSVRGILRRTDYVTGRQLTDGPLYRLGWGIWYVLLVFVIGVFEDPDAGNS